MYKLLYICKRLCECLLVCVLMCMSVYICVINLKWAYNESKLVANITKLGLHHA